MIHELSIVIPAYNEAKRLPQALRLLLPQVESRFEKIQIIVVDDGSTDSTARIVKDEFGMRVSPALAIAALLIAIFLNPGCINLKIVPPDDPGWGTGFFIITNEISGIEEDGGTGLEERGVSVSDENIYAVLKIVNVDRKAKIRWHWYGPGGALVKKSENWEVNPHENYLDYFLIWDSLESRFYKKKGGDGRYHFLWTGGIILPGLSGSVNPGAGHIVA